MKYDTADFVHFGGFWVIHVMKLDNSVQLVPTNRMDKVSCKVLDISSSYVTRLCTEPLFSFRQENGLAHRAFVKGHGASKPYQKVG